MSQGIEISVVCPVFKGSQTVEPLVQRLRESLGAITPHYEILLVEDGSPDDSWEQIRLATKADSRVKGLRLSRNFGQHYAITAGLKDTRGAWVVVLDCDLQDRPEEISRLYAEALEKDLDLVYARRQTRKDSVFRRAVSKMYYAVFSFLTDTKQDSSVGNFGIYRRSVIDAILSMGDSVRYFPTMSQWVGFRRGYLDVEHAARTAGKSTYTLSKLLSLAAHNMVAFSNKPLRLTVALGTVMSSASFLLALYYLVKYLRGEIVVLGYTSLILSIWFIGGMVIALVGMVGIYVGYTFERVKGRPTFIVQERLNWENDERTF